MTRHWQQHWDPDAPLEFTKRMKLGIPEHEIVYPGDPVTDEIRMYLGGGDPSGKRATARLRIWWQGGFIQKSDWQPPQRRRQEPSLGDYPTIEGPDGAWFTVRYPDGRSKRVRGRRRAEELAGV